MASNAVSAASDSFQGAALKPRPLTIWRLRDIVLTPIASLKITVTLFAMAIFIVLVGTLAQVSMDMWDVLDSHFQSWVTWIDFQVFAPKSWFPRFQNIPGGFWFPGGASIGLAMVINLTAAHLVRFKIQARGTRLLAGLGIFAAGAFLTALVIASGHNHTGLQGEAPIDGEKLWLVVKLGLGALAMGSLVAAMLLPLSAESRKLEQYLLYALAALSGGVTVYLFMAGQSAYPGASGMRILWQLMKGGLAGFVMLGGTMLLYKKRGGVALVHMGVALLMFGQFWVANYDVEEQISLGEGETQSYAHDIRTIELAVIDGADERRDEVVVIPQSILHASASGGRTSWLGSSSAVSANGVIEHEFLPFSIQVLNYFQNAEVRDVVEADENVATAGLGKRYLAVPVRASTGTDSDAAVDMAATYVRLRAKDGLDLGVYMVSQLASSQNVTDHITVGDKEYEVSLRFTRNYKPYSVTLVDVRKDDYLGTSTVRNFSSDIRLVDTERGTDREIHIWMNNPLRYAGETFYQSGYSGPPDFRTESTTLAVVTNSGWMIPYVACMVVGVGLLAHFLSVLMRFLKRRDSRDTLMAWGTHAEMAGGGLGILGLISLLFVAVRGRDQGARDLAAPGPETRRRRKKAPAASALAKGGEAQEVYTPSLEAPRLSDAIGALFPLVVVGIFAALFFMAARPRAELSGEMNLSHFGELPVIADGRVKPFDTLARNTLRVISNRETFRRRRDTQALKAEWPRISADLAAKWDGVSTAALTELAGDVDATVDLIVEETGRDRYRVEESVDKLTTESAPAIHWLLDVVSLSEPAQQHKVFRIDNLEVLDTLGLQRRKSHLYSVGEILRGVEEFEKQVELARQTGVEQMSTYQRKIVELDGRVRTYTRLAGAFRPPVLPRFPTAEEYQQDRSAAEQKIRLFQQERMRFIRNIDSIKPALAVPERDAEGNDTWECFAKAWTNARINQLIGQETSAATEHMTVILASYQAGDAKVFNSELAKYRRWLHRNRPQQLNSKSTYVGRAIERRFGSFFEFEAYFNRVSPFFFCWWPYLTAFTLSALAWLGWNRPLNRASFWLIVFTLIVHTIALGARIYISGRPPVTNLYSSAVFIGWSVVLFALAWELFYRNGIGNVLGSALGFAGMVIAHNLAGDGDTFTVLVAVLDTQFWLATHVVTVTLGYATTFFAGFLGVVYVLRGWFTRSLTPDTSKELSRMIYGTVCFSLFFSFVGTVLGGLWADDSWGRFWGWDPKENGALIIVLWNALVLHARWGGIVKERGLAVLSVGGNIVTAWSWFGVNELGVGLHSYGFTEGALLNLRNFVLIQLAVIALGTLPRSLWTSVRKANS